MIEEAEIRALFDRYLAASDTRDFANVAPMIHPRALFRFTEGDFAGLSSIQSAFERTWAGGSEDSSYQLSNLEIACMDAMSACVTYSYTWTGRVDGRSFEVHGRGTNVIVRENGRLQFLLEHLSR